MERLRLKELAPPATRPASALASPLPAETERLVIDAERRISRGDFQGAVGLLHDAAAQAGDQGRIAKDLGLAYLGLGDQTQALECLRRAEQTTGDDLLLQLLVGQLEAAAGRTEEALLALRRALHCTGATPEDGLTAEVMLSLADLLAQTGYLTAAEECYAQLGDAINQYGRNYTPRPRLRPLVVQSGRLLARRGELLSRLGRHAEARHLLQQAYARDRTDMHAAELLLGALLEAKDFTAAEAMLLDLATEPTAQGQLPEFATRLCQAAKDPALPVRLWRAGRQSAVDVGALAVALAKAAREFRAEADAREILSSALETRPHDVGVGCFVAESHARAGDAPAAVRQLATLLAANDEAVDPVVASLEGMADQKLLPEGLEERIARDAAAETSDLTGPLHYLAGELAAIRGHPALAAEQYQASVDDDGRFLPAYEAAAQMHLDAGRFDQVDRLVARVEKLAESDQRVRYYALYLAGKSHLAQGHLTAAAQALEASTQRYDGFAPAVELLAEAYSRLGLADRAVQTLEELVKLQPDDEDAYRKLFDLCVAMGRVDQARAATVRLLRACPDSRAGQAMLVELLVLTGKAEEGARVLGELQRQAGDDPAVRLLTVRLAAGSAAGVVTRRQFDDWLIQIGEVLVDQPDSLPARRLLAELLSRSGAHGQSAAVLSELYAQYPGLAELAKGYALELIQSGDRAAAQAILEGNPALQQDFQARQMLVGVLVEQDRLTDAAAHLRQWLETSTDRKFQDSCRLQLLGIYEKLHDFAAAQRLIDELLAASPPREARVRLQALRVKRLCLEGKVDQAVDLAQTWTRDDGDVALKLVLVEAMAEAKRYQHSQDLLDEWIRRTDVHQDALAETKMLLLVRAGRLDPALRYARGWIGRRPGDLAPRRIAVAALIEAGQHERALKLVDGWLARLGSVRRTTQPAATTQPRQEAASSRAAAVTQPPSASTRTPNATQTSSASVPSSATTSAATSQPTTRGVGALPVRRPATADELAASRSWCREAAVQLLLMTGQTTQALDRLTAYLQADPDNASLRNIQATVLSELGRDAESLAALEQAHALASTDAGICNNLGYVYADKGIHLEQAEGLIRKALIEHGDLKDFLDSLGWVLYKRGKLSAAGLVFERLLEGDKAVWPTCAVSYDHAGDVFYRLGWTDRAAELWAQAIGHARRDKSPGREVRRILAETPGKIQAARTGLTPAVAPLGEGVEGEGQP
ncbi:MAG: tetratricopeptide repeat protein [Phycisphaerae bacterium]|nr:tetratricopeptide repeat protein [Phycisphaerae bacterium]